MEKGLDELRKLLVWMSGQVELLATEADPLQKKVRMAGLVATANIFQEKAESLEEKLYVKSH